MYDPGHIPNPHCTVRPTDLESPTNGAYPRNYHTISAALANLPPVDSSYPTTYRIIRAAPGVYNENISHTGSPLQVAILPERTGEGALHAATNYPVYDPTQRWELKGTSTTTPVVAVDNGSLVLDGFIISGAVGSSNRPIVRVR